MKKTKRLARRHREGGESAVIKRIEDFATKTTIHGSGVLLGIGDDAALFRGRRGYDQILTCDWFLEGTHFLLDRHPPDAVGWKCLARAVSDVAAMGGVPRCFLLSLALPATHTASWLDQFLRGLRRAAGRFDCALAGGDTTRRKDILINVTVVGEARRGTSVLRSSAQPGDILFVSGRLGEAELGLHRIRHGKRLANHRDPLLRKHLYPEPRLALGQWLAENRLASAMMDVSDGLSTDLPRLCAASRVGARITAPAIPRVRVPNSGELSSKDPLHLALHSGDDYELLFAVPRRKLQDVPHSFHGLPITAIGETTARQTLLLVGKDGRETVLLNRGWDTFRK